jgi:NADH-quinone oxidoreductase subunit C
MADAPAPEAPESAPAEPEPERVHGCVTSWSRRQQVVHPDRSQYVTLLKALLDDGYEMCCDLTAVDYLGDTTRVLPDAVAAERFEVVVSLLSLSSAARIRVRLQVPADDPVVPTLFDVWPGTEAMEREVFDMFGITFEGHPDMTRILMPEDWVGFPLRKDYDTGAIPVQFIAAPQARR